MLILIGLGNPGLRFRKTRHNIGFRVLDAFQKAYSRLRPLQPVGLSAQLGQDGPTGISLKSQYGENNFPKFKLNKKSRAEISRGVINGQEILLAKPQTYMNESGFAVKALISNLKLQIANLIIVHDDFDLPFGEVKIVENSGSAGHHGVESIIQALGTRNFKRLKIGIRPNYELSTMNYKLIPKAEDFVLKKFSKVEENNLAEIIKNAIIANLLTMASR